MQLFRIIKEFIRTHAVVFRWYVTPYPWRSWGISKWEYFSQTSWRHGAIYLWKLKIMW